MTSVSMDEASRDKIRGALLAWYDAHRRDLPWRARPGERPEPYRVWLSEIMLQQTTVLHAMPYFLRFLDTWPTVEALAAAPDAEVMAAWAGLGYYARARNLLACARVVAERHLGRFPSTEAGLRALPGAGAYTAAAIAAIAFDQPANVVDGNVERVISRLFAVEAPMPKAKRELSALAATLATRERPGDWAQALMDLGSGVCRPKRPLCLVCPLAADCRARSIGNAERFPVRSAKAARPHRFGAVYVLRDGGDVAVVERPKRGLLGGMLGLPTTEWRDQPFAEADAFKVAPSATAWSRLGEVEHVFTHFSLTLIVLAAETPVRNNVFTWLPISEARSSLPSLFRKALEVQAAPRSARALARKVSIGARPASVRKCQ